MKYTNISKELQTISIKENKQKLMQVRFSENPSNYHEGQRALFNKTVFSIRFVYWYAFVINIRNEKCLSSGTYFNNKSSRYE